MTELNSFIENNTKHFIDEFQIRLNSEFDLHKINCLLLNKKLTNKQVYEELCLHLYTYRHSSEFIAKEIMLLYYQYHKKEIPTDPKVKTRLLTMVYIPKVELINKKHFMEMMSLFDKYLNEDFYIQLPSIATYTGIKYLSYYLPLNKLPKVRKPRTFGGDSIWGLSKKGELEFEYIYNTSEFTKYENGEWLRREGGYYELCQWCKKVKLTFSIARLISIKGNHIFVCSKRCADAARMSIKRYGILKPRTV